MLPVNWPVKRFFIDTMYFLSIAVIVYLILACSTPLNPWKYRILLSYICLILLDATCVALLGIIRILGCTGRTHGTFDSVAYLVFVMKITRCL